MNTLMPLISLVAAVLAGILLCSWGGWISAWTMRTILRSKGQQTTLKPLWKVATLTFLVSLLLGNLLQRFLGDPSPLTAAIGIPVVVMTQAWLLRRRLPAEFAATPAWWRAIFTGLAGIASGLLGILLSLPLIGWLFL